MFNALKQLGPILVLAVLIRSYKLGGFKKKHLFLTVLKVEVRDQGPAWSGSQNPLSGSQTTVFLPRPHRVESRESKQALFCVSSSQGTKPIMRAPLSSPLFIFPFLFVILSSPMA